jgi:hypothetical protein
VSKLGPSLINKYEYTLYVVHMLILYCRMVFYVLLSSTSEAVMFTSGFDADF